MYNNGVSIAKAVGIILMVLAHTRFSEYGNLWINMFHMPLFFFLSGYCFKASHLSDPKKFALKRVKGLWWPFLKWMFVFAVLHNVFYFIGFYTDNPEFLGAKGGPVSIYQLSDYPYILSNIMLMTHNEQLLGGFLFLKTLFYASLIGFCMIYMADKLNLKRWSFVFFTMIILFGISVLGTLKTVRIPFLSVGPKEFIAALFFVFGYGYKLMNIKCSRYLAILVPLSIITITVGMEYWQMTLLNVTWWKIIPYFLSSMLASVTIFEICVYWSNSNSTLVKYPVYIGENTMTILTWHLFSFKFVNLLIIYIYSLPYGMVGAFPAIESYACLGWFLLYLLVGIMVPCLFSRYKILK